MTSAALAERSLDVQYYLWHNDLTGRTLAGELLRAADRGVRVRVLIDDVSARTTDDELASLDAHELIEVRVFNPFRTRGSAIGNGLEFIGGGGRVNHRMHNKLWIADSRLAIVGGRNIGDEYFGAHEQVNFGDLGVLVAGHVVTDAGVLFDEYWNSDSVVPISALERLSDPATAIAKARTTLEAERVTARDTPYGARLLKMRDKGALELGLARMLHGAKVRVVADDPSKSKGSDDGPQIMFDTMVGLLRSAQSEAVIVSPYFVIGSKGSDMLLDMQARGIATRVLTNSLAANDVAAVHGGYSKQRERLLSGGVTIHEIKPKQKMPHDESGVSSGASLHAKALIIDRSVAFVGSFNMDPRSAHINTESGIVIDDPAFATALRARYELATTRERSWELALDGGKIVWLDEIDGKPVTLRDEPPSSMGHRFKAWLFRVLPLDSQL